MYTGKHASNETINHTGVAIAIVHGGHVDDNEDHEWIEETGAPEESKQLESEKTGNYLKIDCFREKSCYGQSRRVKNILEEWKWI